MNKRIWCAIGVAALGLPTSMAMAASVELTQSQIHLVLDPDDLYWESESHHAPVERTHQFGLNDGAQHVQINKDLPDSDNPNIPHDGLAFVDYITQTNGNAQHFEFSSLVDGIERLSRSTEGPYRTAMVDIVLTFTAAKDLTYCFEAEPEDDTRGFVNFFQVVFDGQTLKAETSWTEGYVGNFPIEGIVSESPDFGPFVQTGTLAAGEHTLHIRLHGQSSGFVSLDLQVVPTPAAAAAGLAMLAGFAARRRH